MKLSTFLGPWIVIVVMAFVVPVVVVIVPTFFRQSEPVGKPERYTDLLWFEVTEQKESSGDTNAIGAVGERGLYQIGRDFWTDGCEGAGVSFNYDALVTDRAACQIVIRGYWKKYKAITYEQKSRLHNGGPRGMQKESTIEYWNDIEKRMDEQSRKESSHD